MSTKDKHADQSRRKFLVQVGGAAIGAITLSACGRGPAEVGNGIATRGGPLPTGYKFYPLHPGDLKGLPGGLELSPLVMLNDAGLLLLYAGTSGGYGLFSAELGLSGGAPAVKIARALLTTGTTLADGRRVDSIESVDLNDHGSIAVVLGTDGEVASDDLALMAPGVYLSRESRQFELIAGLGRRVPGRDGILGGVFGDLALQNQDNLLLTAMYAQRDPTQTAPADTVFSGLFHLPSASLADGRDIVGSTTMLRGTDRSIAQLGLVDLASNGQYAAQVFAASPAQALQAIMTGAAAPPSESYVISGSVGAASGAIDVLRPGAPQNRPAGNVYFGPRVAADGRQALVIHYSDTDAALYFGATEVIRTGAMSPLGSIVRGLSAPVTGPDGLLFFLLSLDPGFELCVTNGAKTATILATGQQIGDRKIVTAMHGYHSAQADGEARIAFYGRFDDGSDAVLIGVPV